jgi:hypothetical protein
VKSKFLTAAAAAGLIVAGSWLITPALAASKIELRTLSSRPDMASGGDALVEIALPAGLASSDVTVRLNQIDVTSAFVPDAAGHKLVGLVSGLSLGNNTLRATPGRVRGNQVRAGALVIRNFPATGPILSGVRESPWICETSASGLGAPPASGPCIAPTRYDWFYRTTANTFLPLPSTSRPYPADLAQTTTIDGHTVPYIVRVESGVINESIYRIAILDDPAAPITDPWRPGGKKPSSGWNGKLTWPFGGGASPGFRSGSNRVTSALQHDALSLGFAVAFGTRNTYGTGMNDVISAETVMMIKERFIEQYGVPKFTIGSGGSGGSMLQHYIAQNYPGLLDALTAGISYPDLTSITSDVIDCRLLGAYFDHVVDPAAWPGERRAAVDGYAVASAGRGVGQTVCQTGWAGFPNNWPNPGEGAFSSAIPPALIYDPVENPGGIRGTFWDANVNAFGRNPATGFARTTYDNVGVQYGLLAVNSGAITPEEFVHLNEHIGGIDIDANLTPQRSVGDPIGLRRAYASGRIVTAYENMTLPIIDTRGYTDLRGDIHTRERTLMFLERLKRGNGATANQVNWTYTGTDNPNIARLALLAHNQWLENIAADTSNLAYAAKVIRNRPAEVKDACWVNGTKIEEPISWDPTTACNIAMPVHKNVRLMAGGAVTGDVLKCKLKPLSFTSYQVTFTPAQQSRLRDVFPNGVCDWASEGVGQAPLQGAWINYSKDRWGPANLRN